MVVFRVFLTVSEKNVNDLIFTVELWNKFTVCNSFGMVLVTVRQYRVRVTRVFENIYELEGQKNCI